MDAKYEFSKARQRFYDCEYPPARAALWADVEYWAERCGADLRPLLRTGALGVP